MPSEVTTTSESVLSLAVMTMEKEVRSPISISCEDKPTAETTSVLAVAGRLRLKDPSGPELVPVREFLIRMLAPGIGLPLASLIFPVIVRVCANKCNWNSRNRLLQRSLCFLIEWQFCFGGS